jgi:lysophospholipid acyltransferase (LPLAT)-like uncharacterized protein
MDKYSIKNRIGLRRNLRPAGGTKNKQAFSFASTDMYKHGIGVKLKGRVLSAVLRFQRLTWRIHIENHEYMKRLYAANKGFLLCFWHGKYVPILPLLEGCEAIVISTQSERGSIIAEICRNFGYQSIQIPDRSRRVSYRLMVEMLAGAAAGGLAVDGPLGPRHRVKIDVIRVASALGFDLLPVSVGSRRKIVCNRRWDRIEIPLPFTKVCLAFGEPIQVPSRLRPGQIRTYMNKLAETIAQLDEKAEKIVRESDGQGKTLARS